ncbi:CLOCK-interacting pacemaker [Antennarius striatus]|uniref:CLOCK-interacting pacemaker n=1 Tax=Antennarius striatus TaxID=241820 RepID=UPI0035B103C8
MPKDQPCLGKLGLCASSSKNAKDKSNNTTLLAIRNTENTADSSGQGSCHSSEKDSGYSDVSDWQQTDAEDRNKSQTRASEHPEPSQPCQTKEHRQENAVNPPSSIGIIDKMALKQPDIQKKRQLPRRSINRGTSSSGAAHVILLQQPNLFLTNLQLHKPTSRKCSTTGKVATGAYLPILKSYPRIAPHPSKKPPDEPTLNDKIQNLSKRVCTEHKSDSTAVTSSLPEQHLHKQPKLDVSTPMSSSARVSPASSSPTTVSSSQVSSRSSPCATSPFLLTRGLHRNGTTSARHRRFLNTAEILRQSGLMDITLRTKELLRQSNATERDIAQLRQHTELLCRAASDVNAWEHLHRSMAESGSYPNLQNLQMLYCVDSASQTKNSSVDDTNGSPATDKSEVSQSHSVPGRDQGCESSDKVTFMPPDSSTG